LGQAALPGCGINPEFASKKDFGPWPLAGKHDDSVCGKDGKAPRKATWGWQEACLELGATGPWEDGSFTGKALVTRKKKIPPPGGYFTSRGLNSKTGMQKLRFP